MRVEQLVYTSASTTRAKGYQTIGHSPGISKEERQAIEWHSSLKQDLPGSAAFTGSLSYFRLETGRPRACVARTFPKGVDHAGREGRVLTHVLVLDWENFEALGCDPFAVSRRGRFLDSDDVPSEMPRLDLPPGDLDSSESHDFGEGVKAGSVEGIYAAASAGRRVVLLYEGSVSELLEVVVTSAPPRFRSDLTFSTFQLSPEDTAFRLVGVPKVMARGLRGEDAGYAVLDVERGALKVGAPRSAFAELAGRSVSARSSKVLEGLHKMASELDSHGGLEDLDALTELFLAREKMREAPSPGNALEYLDRVRAAGGDKALRVGLTHCEESLDAFLLSGGEVAPLLGRMAELEGDGKTPGLSAGTRKALRTAAGRFLKEGEFEAFCRLHASLERIEPLAVREVISAASARFGDAAISAASRKSSPSMSDLACMAIILNPGIGGSHEVPNRLAWLLKLASSPAGRSETGRKTVAKLAMAYEDVARGGRAGTRDESEIWDVLLKVYEAIRDEEGQVRLCAELAIVSGEREQWDRLDEACKRLLAVCDGSPQGGELASSITVHLQQGDREAAREILVRCLELENDPRSEVWKQLFRGLYAMKMGFRLGREKHLSLWSRVMKRYEEVDRREQAHMLSRYLLALPQLGRLGVLWRTILVSVALGFAAGLAFPHALARFYRSPTMALPVQEVEEPVERTDREARPPEGKPGPEAQTPPGRRETGERGAAEEGGGKTDDGEAIGPGEDRPPPAPDEPEETQDPKVSEKEEGAGRELSDDGEVPLGLSAAPPHPRCHSRPHRKILFIATG